MLAGKMVSPEEQPTESNPIVPAQSQGGGRRRGRRGGRGRGRGPRQSPQSAPADQSAGAPSEATVSIQPEPSAAAATGKDSSAISRAIDEVRQIVQSLEQALEQMEEVQELVDLADRQKSADDREIESLRRVLRRIQQPRGHKDTPHEPGGD
jgi:hypothetical protein